ncbi:FANCD2 opposite strand protein-like [Heptranchias perlo]|uniref:FANCD2 opposite strand protein-like n=1 Tax=Heptranchias perlo TaxID=212740 RepID=UPI0035596E68
MTAYQLWDPWTPFEESFQWVGYSTSSLRELDGAETVQMPSPSDQEVALYLQDDVVTDDWNLLDLLVETGKVTPETWCYTSETEHNTTTVVYKPQPVKLSSVDSVFGRAITTGAPKLAGGFQASEGSAFTEIISVGSPTPILAGRFKINLIVMIYKQLLRIVTLIYTAYQKCFYVLQHSI